jgi:hypothetical protein
VTPGRAIRLREPWVGASGLPKPSLLSFDTSVYSSSADHEQGPATIDPDFKTDMEKESVPRLRVLVTDGPGVRLDEVTRTVAELGHDVIARESSLPEVARITATERPDVALVVVHEGK